MKQIHDFRVLFDSLEKAKETDDYQKIKSVMDASDAIQAPIDRLKEIVTMTERQKYSVIITT